MKNFFARLIGYWGAHDTGEKRRETSNWTKAMENLDYTTDDRLFKAVRETKKAETEIQKEKQQRANWPKVEPPQTERPEEEIKKAA